MTDTRGHTARQDEVRQERRRRDDATIDGGQARKLAIPHDVEEKLRAAGRTPRWINVEVDKNGQEIGSRLQDLTVRDDYDRVEGVEPRTVVTNRKTGETAMAYLVSKPTAFIEEDRAKKDKVRRDMEDGMLRGAVPGTNPKPGTVETYADKANKIERGSNQLI